MWVRKALKALMDELSLKKNGESVSHGQKRNHSFCGDQQWQGVSVKRETKT